MAADAGRQRPHEGAYFHAGPSDSLPSDRPTAATSSESGLIRIYFKNNVLLIFGKTQLKLIYLNEIFKI